MPPRQFSRHIFALGIRNAGSDVLYLTDRNRFKFRELPDTIQHLVALGDTLHNVAARYYAPLERPAGLWWVVADFQPDPIHDPTIALSPGTVLFVPSLRTVIEEVFSESRRLEPNQ